MRESGCLGVDSGMWIARSSLLPTIIQEIIGTRLFHDAIHSGQPGVFPYWMVQVLAGIEADAAIRSNHESGIT